eukprot:UN00492
MYRNQYDTDVQTFSPAGRLFQVEYACEAVKQGAVAVGAVNKDFAVIGCLKRRENELASYHKKIYKIDEHVGAVLCGLIPDGAEQINYLRSVCDDEQYAFESNIPINRLALKLCDHNQEQTQKDGKRPTGVGLLIAGYDQRGAHLFESLPNAEYNEYLAQAIGARSQSAITYLERQKDTIAATTTLDDLVKHVIHAIRQSHEDVLQPEQISIAVVGKGMKFTIYDFDDKLTGDKKNDAAKAKLEQYLAVVEQEIAQDDMVDN